MDIELPQPVQLQKSEQELEQPRMLKPLTSDQKKIDRALKTRGLGGLDDPNLMKQLAFLVRNHEHYSKLLVHLDPVKRKECYDATSPYLRFKPKPLEDYVRAGAERFERESQKHAYITQSEIDIMAQDAIRKQQAIDQNKGLLKIYCETCPREEGFIGTTAKDAYAAARLDGWRKVIKLQRDYFLCPQCSIASEA